MKLSKSRYSSLCSFLKTRSRGEFDLLALSGLDPARGGKDVESLDSAMLRRLIKALPSGASRIIHPKWARLRGDLEDAARNQRPAYFNDSWPRVYRFLTKLNNARAGLIDGPAGQILKLNPKAMATPLKGTIRWNESNGGDLVIMGRRSDITKALTDAGKGVTFRSSFDIAGSDVNMQFDKMYTDEDLSRLEEMPLYVSYEGGATWAATDTEGEVVLNAPRAIIELFVGRAAGLAGAAANLPKGGAGIALASTSAAKDLTGMTAPHAVEKWQNAQQVKRQTKSDDNYCTITVGIVPASKTYLCTDTSSLDGDGLLRHVVGLVR